MPALMKQIDHSPAASEEMLVQTSSGSRYLPNRLNKKHGIEFMQYDPGANLKRSAIDPVADARNMCHINQFRDKGSCQASRQSHGPEPHRLIAGYEKVVGERITA